MLLRKLGDEEGKDLIALPSNSRKMSHWLLFFFLPMNLVSCDTKLSTLAPSERKST